MRVRDLAEVLSGLTRAFSTIAQEDEIQADFDLRIKDIQPGSVRLIFEAIDFAKSNPGAAAAIATGAAVALNAVTKTVSGAYRIITDLAKVIYAKKKAKGERISTMPASFRDDGVALTAPDELILLTKEQYELLLSRRIDRPIAQIVSPLTPKRVDSLEIRRSQTELVRVEAPQRDYFDYQESQEALVREGTEILGTLNSLSKNNLRGTFYTADGVHVPYRYVGGDTQQLLRGFSSREPLRVRGKIRFDADGVPSFIEVQDIDMIQRNFFSS